MTGNVVMIERNNFNSKNIHLFPQNVKTSKWLFAAKKKKKIKYLGEKLLLLSDYSLW